MNRVFRLFVLYYIILLLYGHVWAITIYSLPTQLSSAGLLSNKPQNIMKIVTMNLNEFKGVKKCQVCSSKKQFFNRTNSVQCSLNYPDLIRNLDYPDLLQTWKTIVCLHVGRGWWSFRGVAMIDDELEISTDLSWSRLHDQCSFMIAVDNDRAIIIISII